MIAVAIRVVTTPQRIGDGSTCSLWQGRATTPIATEFARLSSVLITSLRWHAFDELLHHRVFSSRAPGPREVAALATDASPTSHRCGSWPPLAAFGRGRRPVADGGSDRSALDRTV